MIASGWLTSIDRLGTSPQRSWAGRVLAGTDARIKILSVVAGLIIWQILGATLDLSWLPSFGATVRTLVQLIQNGEIVRPLLATLQDLLVGFLIAAVLGTTMGVLIGRFRRIEQALMIYVNLMLFTPALIFAPIYSAVFGLLSSWTRLAIVVHFAVFVITANAASGIRNVSPELLEMAKSFGCGPVRTFYRVLLPGSTLMIFAGLRIGLGLAVKGAVIGEMYVSAAGLGHVADKYGGAFNAAAILAVTIVIAVMGVVVRGRLSAVERRLTHWAG